MPLLGFRILAGLVFVIIPFLVREEKKSVQAIHGMSVCGRQVGEGLVQGRMGRTKTGHGHRGVVVVMVVVVGVTKTCGIVVCIHVIVHDSSHCCCGWRSQQIRSSQEDDAMRRRRRRGG